MAGTGFQPAYLPLGIGVSMPRFIMLLLHLLLTLPAAAQAPGTVVKDCPECPEMVVIPAGFTRLCGVR